MLEIIFLIFLIIFAFFSTVGNLFYIFLLNNKEKMDEIDEKTHQHYLQYSVKLIKGEKQKFLFLSPIEWKAHFYFTVALAVGFFSNIFVGILLTFCSFVLLCVKKRINN